MEHGQGSISYRILYITRDQKGILKLNTEDIK